MKNAIIIVPHLDDELLVGGGMLWALAHSSEWNVKVVFATNGDFYQHEAEIRLKEALLANKKLGISENGVIFLGYGDRWNGGHLYNSAGNCVSKAGYTHTYALKNHPEYCYNKWGIHHVYTRENLKYDLLSVIKDYYPDLLICVDFDIHPDHRALSLIFLEVIHDILVRNPKYKPLILKKLAYENVMHGKKDYYSLPHQRTYNSGNNLFSTPILKWNERMCFEVPKECDTLRLTRNPLFIAASQYKSQRIRFRMISAINSDIVYWRIPSENHALEAKVTVSSGNGLYINDLKTIDSDDINVKQCLLDASVWIPESTDEKKSVRLSWEQGVDISKIIFYENPSSGSDIYELLIIIDNKLRMFISDVKHDGSANIISFDRMNKISNIEFRILSGTTNAGITEISVFDNLIDVDSYKLPCKLLDLDEKSNSICERNLKSQFISNVDYFYVFFMKLFTLVRSSKYVLMRHYPICREKKYLIPFCRIYNILYNVLKILKEIYSK